MDTQPPTFDTTLASHLFPQLVQLIQAASLQKPTAEDPEARVAKVEVGKQASHLRSALAALRTQAAALPAGEMSLDDQAWLIEQLEERLETKKTELSSLAKLIPSDSGAEGANQIAMEMD
ncbi:hypothetical protein BCR35DRAFT_299503 [Leucosporidium creatinivorum]|uniref:Mediator of RNA polymerase II transcription subunit 9 n=1 Tax=Leucosporidium creatinivorum TaxID=106004 RepID=A0A1Y2G1V8_9BASI|nr:hypothetical protein BCR35DRAFT_299503 [Leucosporidium creatinivorum]